MVVAAERPPGRRCSFAVVDVSPSHTLLEQGILRLVNGELVDIAIIIAGLHKGKKRMSVNGSGR